MDDSITVTPGSVVSTAARRELIWMLGALSSFAPLAFDMYLPGLPSLTRSLHASASAAQLTLTASVVGIALGQLFAGPASDSRGRRRPLLAGLVGFSVASVLCAISPSVWMLIVARLLQGVAGGTGIVIARAIVRDTFDGITAARVFATLVVISGVAPIFAPLIGGQVLEFSSWRGIFLVLAGIGAVLLALALRRVPETLPVEERHAGGLRQTLHRFGQLLRDREFMPFAVSFSVGFGTLFAYIAGGSFVLENVYGFSAQAFSAVFAANSIGFVAGSQLSRLVVARVGVRRLFRIGLMIAAAAAAATLIACITHADVGVLIASLFVMVSSLGLATPNGMAAAMASRPDALGSASGLIGLSQFGIAAVLAPLVGAGGPDNALPMGIVMAGCAAVALAVNLVFVRAKSL